MKTSANKIALIALMLVGCYRPQRVAAQVQDSVLSVQVAELSRQVAALKSGDSHFMVAGLTTFGFVNQKTVTRTGGLKTSMKYNSLGDASRYELSPLFLWRHGTNLLIEFEPSFNGVSLGVNWAAISYFIIPGLILRGGYLVLPFGSYSKRLAAGWMNKLASDPVGVNPAGSDFGIEAEGSFPLGSMKWGYDLALSNGFQLDADGTNQGVGIQALTNNKTLTGRVSWIPLLNSSLELGVSGLFGRLATPVGSTAHPIKPVLSMFALDLNYIRTVSIVQLNIKGQYSFTGVNRQSYISPLDSTRQYTFTNKTTASYAQISFRPVQANQPFLRNLEFALRYVTYKTPSGSAWGQVYTESDYGLDYWLSWRTVLKFTYENIQAAGTSSVLVAGPQGSTGINRMVLQFSTEF